MGNLMTFAAVMGLTDDDNQPHEQIAAPAQAPAPPEPVERRNAWQICRNGKPICTMVGEPMTYDEALAAAQYRWPDANLAP